jgi:hypothetical protein
MKITSHLRVCVSPLTTFEGLIEASCPKKEAVGEEHN